MIKVVVMARRRRDVSVEQYRAHLFGTHVPLALKLPKLRRLSESLVRHDLRESEWDSVAEMWFDSHEDFVEAMRSPEGDVGRADSAEFMDVSATKALILEEQEIPQPG